MYDEDQARRLSQIYGKDPKHFVYPIGTTRSGFSLRDLDEVPCPPQWRQRQLLQSPTLQAKWTRTHCRRFTRTRTWQRSERTLIDICHIVHAFLEELDSYLYQTVGQDAIEFVARALDIPLYRRFITGDAVEQGSEYGGRNHANAGGIVGDETEDLYALLSTVKVPFINLRQKRV